MEEVFEIVDFTVSTANSVHIASRTPSLRPRTYPGWLGTSYLIKGLSRTSKKHTHYDLNPNHHLISFNDMNFNFSHLSLSKFSDRPESEIRDAMISDASLLQLDAYSDSLLGEFVPYLVQNSKFKTTTIPSPAYGPTNKVSPLHRWTGNTHLMTLSVLPPGIHSHISNKGY